ncbi:hypothetical protein [Bartonella sp. HY038]|uniref:hypothetical protein n=1 Tax=Bartonella sp. HY038 TaxID=2759660 RepID=UPI0015FAC551|nr:hypothetical protein [Bartonella sp. HY038]
MKKSIIFLAFVLFLGTSTYQASGTDYGPSRIDDDYVSNDNIIIDDEDKLDLTINSNNGPIYIRLPDGEPLFFAPPNEDTAIEYGSLSGFISELEYHIFKENICNVYKMKGNELTLKCQKSDWQEVYSLKKDENGFQIYSIDDGIKVRTKTADIITYMYDKIIEIEVGKALDQ